MKKSSQKEAQWRAVVNEQASSGLSVRQFCAKSNISEPSFYSWRRELRLRDQVAGNNGKPRQPDLTNGESGTDFVAIKLVDSESSGTMELVHPTGYLVRVVGDVNPRSLEQVLDLLDTRGSRP